MSGFFETRVENLETPAPPPAVRSLTRKKKKKNSKKRKVVFFEDFDKDSLDKEKPFKKKFCQYNRKCSHSTDECATLEALIKKGKSNTSKGHRKEGEKTYTKHKVNVLIEKKLKKTFKGRKKRKQELRTFEKMEVSGSEESNQTLDDSNASSKSNDS